ncbi:hypothetical protein M422DRAFT_30404 [Sphaerobolus stellatus SS14]|uniref:RING-type E3 ubiquitin transferase n=1 Tax=Sphaerobolus stellatus (strain SS14) TaxID=990650 RepID=A0A0C9UMJ6_SPHS4|nr:hypothetical protein M422DRAFT_30404 [Sphaerobolus stellatus SS14]
MSTTTTSPTTVSETRQTNPRRGRGRGGKQQPGQRKKNTGKESAPANSATGSTGDNTPSADAQNEEEQETCWICAEPVKYYSVSECNHRTCHVCALRLRALYKRMDCTFCKHSQATLIFTLSPDQDYESFTPESIPFKDSKLSVYFETQEMMEDSLILLKFNCPDSSCDFIAHGWGDLKIHVRATHGKAMCDMCIRHKKVFSHEHILYQPSQLPLHLPSISHRPPARNQAQNKVEGGAHPLCEFCRECYFGDDELFAHMRERHEECFLCKRSGIRDQYFKDYNGLEEHFNLSHFPCNDSHCQAQKFVVFGSLLDLKAHFVEAHGKDMSAKDLKDMRRVEATFEYDDRGEGGAARQGGRGRGRGRDREPPEVGPARNARRGGFGSTLTGSTEVLSPQPPQPQPPRERNDPESQLDPAVAERHTLFISRLNMLTANSSNAVQAVRAAIRSYRASESGPRDLISTIFNVVDRDLDSSASLISGLIDILDDEEKRRALLTAWNGFKIEQQRQFPELRAGATGSEYAGVAGGRILNAKHSAAVRSGQSQRQVWDRVAQAAAASSTKPAVKPQERFPSLAASRNAPGFRQAQHTTAWSSAGASSSTSSSPVIRSTAPPVREISRPAPQKISASHFPSLPSSGSSQARPQVRGNQSLKNILGDTANAKPNNAWGQTNEEDGQPTEEAQDSQPEGVSNKGKKKKGKEKQTLFTFGTFPGA